MQITDEDIKNFKKGVDVRLTIDGETRVYTSYLVPLEGLYFNESNGRIATYIDEMRASQNDGTNIDQLLKNNEIDKYNDTIAKFIKKSANDNEASYKKTKKDISEQGQRIPGVILRSGRIIDGNRRFTCLRELFKETGDTRFDFFECVILDDPKTKEQQRSIKLLELNLQFNVDEKKDYDRIDFLVGFYKDTMSPSPDRIDKTTYCRASGLTGAEYDKNKRIVEIMLDYLEWRGQPNAFYLLKNEKLDGPIEELATKSKRLTSDEWNQKKTVIYSYMTFNQTGDRTRDVRAILNSAMKDGVLFRKMKEEIEKPENMNQLTSAVVMLNKKPTNAEETKQKVETTKKIQTNLIQTFQSGKYEETIMEDANAPKKTLEGVLSAIQKIEPLQVQNFPPDKKEELQKIIHDIETYLDGLINE